MKIRMQSALLLLLTGSLFAGAGQAQNIEHAIKARQGLMQNYAFNISLVGAMAKGKAEYNAEVAQNAAENMMAIATMKNGALWPAGSGTDNIEFGDMTRALPENWTTYPASAEKGKKLVAALEEFLKVAGQGLDAMKGGIGDVGNGCKGCHKEFRAKKN
ncbi:MAG: cytochrome c556 [Gammaproteobacteria bacterium]|jgi:cytochrome c556